MRAIKASKPQCSEDFKYKVIRAVCGSRYDIDSTVRGVLTADVVVLFIVRVTFHTYSSIAVSYMCISLFRNP